MPLTLSTAVQYLFVLLLFNTSLFSAHNFSTQIETLSQSQQWLRLLHFKNQQSEIDDKKFFFAQNGKTNPKAELHAFIEKLIADKSDDENSTLCHFPSRSQWILEQLPELKNNIKTPQCKALKKELKELGAKSVTLVLASAHMNSPASAFGHTFLRIDKDEHTPLLAYAINYAAQTKEDNGFVYAYQGLFGGYKGRYSIDPYYKKIKEYSKLEQRDIWEHTLNLNAKELKRLVLHIFEIRHFYADYYFLSENCSYNLLWLIAIAKQQNGLLEQFNHKAIPIDTLRAILSKNLVKKTTYRPSKRKEILTSSQVILTNKKALSFTKSNDYPLDAIKNLSNAEKRATLTLATSLLQIKLADGKISKKAYLPKFLKLLKQRSKLGKTKKIKQTQPPSPNEGHLSSKTTFSLKSHEQLALHSKIAYHDIYDNENAYIAGAYINFFDTQLAYEDKNLKLEELNILDIKSYAIQDEIFKPISWEVSLGAKRIFNDELNGYLKAGGGFTLGSEKLFTYATLTPTIYYKKNSQQSIAGNIGLLYNPSSTLKIGLLTSNEWFSKNKKIEKIEPFLTYSFNQESALNFKYEHKNFNGKRENDASLSWFWYF